MIKNYFLVFVLLNITALQSACGPMVIHHFYNHPTTPPVLIYCLSQNCTPVDCFDDQSQVEKIGAISVLANSGNYIDSLVRHAGDVIASEDYAEKYHRRGGCSCPVDTFKAALSEIKEVIAVPGISEKVTRKMPKGSGMVFTSIFLLGNVLRDRDTEQQPFAVVPPANASHTYHHSYQATKKDCVRLSPKVYKNTWTYQQQKYYSRRGSNKK